MTSEKNWREEVDASDYFLHQRKQLQVADRRPVIRKTADLVGPGINKEAVPITDYNDLLATYNGFYSSSRASNGPAINLTGPDAGFDTNKYVGFVIMDSDIGGVQTFVNMESVGPNAGKTYRRQFFRNPSDPSFISWGTWGTEGSGVEPGVIMGFAGAAAPSGWLLCNGASYSATAYPELFAAIGNTWGGSGSSFNVPDGRDRALYGVGAAWALGGTDGLGYGSRTATMNHTHTGSSSLNGLHNHAILTDGSHNHPIGNANATVRRATDSGTPDNAAGPAHSHALTAAGAHDHFGATGQAPNHSHDITVDSALGMALRGIGVNHIIYAGR